MDQSPYLNNFSQLILNFMQMSASSATQQDRDNRNKLSN